MKTTRTLLAAALAVFITAPPLLADVEIGAQLRITPRPRADLEVYVWPDRGMDAVYYPGENIHVNVELTRDAFLILYNIDTRGQLHILFPASPWDDNFVRGGDVITFPRSWDQYDWTVDGPPGTEYIQAIASEIPISLPEWPVYFESVIGHGRYAPELRDFCAGDDRYQYIDLVNRNICGRYYEWCATDIATFYIRNYPRYHRVSDWDPWPDVFYGSIYIGWPVGARIYVDGIYIGIAPCWVPRHYTGRRVITCYDGPRLIRRHEVNCFPKRDYYVHNRFHDSRAFVYKKGRNDAYDHFRYEKESDRRNRYRIYDRGKERWDDDDRDGKHDADRWRDYDLGTSSRGSSGIEIRKSDGSIDKSNARVEKDDGNRRGTWDFDVKSPKQATNAEVKESDESQGKFKTRAGRDDDDAKKTKFEIKSSGGGHERAREKSSGQSKGERSGKRSKGN